MPGKPTYEELENAVSQLKATLKAIPDLWFEVDQEGCLYHYHAPNQDSLYASSDEFMGKPIREIFPKDAEDIMLSAMADAKESGTHRGAVYSLDLPQGKKWFELFIAAKGDHKNSDCHFIVLARDITEKVKAETTLRNAEEQCRMVIDSVNQGVILQDASGHILTWNKGAENVFGISADQAIGQTSSGFDWPTITEDGSKFEGKDHPSMITLNTGKPLNDVIMGVIQPDDRVTWISINTRPVFRENVDKPSAVVISFSDITEQLKSETALRKSEERFELAMRFVNDGLFDWNLESKQMYYSPGWKKILGYEDHEIENEFSEWERLTKAEDVHASLAMLNDVIEGKRFRFEKEFKMRHKNGHWVDILARANIVRNKNGKAVRLVGTHVDITGQKYAEKEIRQQKQKAEQYLNLASVMFIGIDANGNINLANKKAGQVLECNESEIIGFNWFDNFIPKTIRENVRSVFNELIAGNIEPVEYYENPIVTKTGKEKNIAWHNTVIRDDKENIIGILGSGEDITIRKQLEDQILQSQKLEAISTLAGGIAHDFNNMLGVITGNISYALSRVTKDDDLSEVLSDIQEGARQAQTLTQQLLTFSRGGEPIKKVRDLNRLIKESITFVTRGAAARCEFDLQNDLWTSEIDEGQIKQVLNNLAINAIQAMPDGGIIHISTANMKITAAHGLPLPSGTYVKAMIKDHGIGIPENHISKIFDPFFTTKQKGNGLGLATAYSIINRHGGRILVESEIGVGTTFSIYLPVPTDTVSLTGEVVKASNHQGHGKILVMDDQEQILKMAGRMLNRMGYDTVFAMDGNQAIDLYREAFQAQNPFDLVILDLTVPGGLGGTQTVIELLKMDPNVKAVVSSGYSNDPIMANYQDYGFCGVVPKPYTKNEISELLNTIFDDKV